MRSISSTVIVSAVGRKASLCSATRAQRSAARASRVPRFDRYAVVPVARNVWQQVERGSPAAAARRLIITRTRRRASARPVGLRPAGATLWKSGPSPRRARPPPALLVEPEPSPASLWEAHKEAEIHHEILGRQIGRWALPSVQATLLARHLRGDLPAYHPFVLP